MRRAALVAVVAVLPAALVACGLDDKDEGTSTDPVDDLAASSGCRRVCEYRDACEDIGDVDVCTQDCAASVSGWARADAFAALVECTTSLPCTAGAEQCAGACQPTTAHQQYEARCRHVLGPCLGTPEEVDRVCEVDPGPDGAGRFCLIAPPIVAELRACLAEGVTCERGLTCVTDVLTAHGIAF